jgi:hypothetical protein
MTVTSDLKALYLMDDLHWLEITVERLKAKRFSE